MHLPNFVSAALGQAILLAAIAMVVLALVAMIVRRLSKQNRQLSTALNNMSQGLNMFDAQGRITLLNQRYLDMYKLSADVVKPGCTLQQLLQHRKDTGLFAGEVEPYCRKILEDMEQRRSMSHYVPASDGRIVLAKNEPLPGGGWVSTHEDVTEQRRAEEERSAIRDQEKRRGAIDAAITSFRPQVEKLLSSVSGSATAMRTTANALFGSSELRSLRTSFPAQSRR
jgi:transcriptional regulator with PAS, ATPase and Fis domain